MNKLKAPDFQPIAIYCYVLGVYFIFLAGSVALGKREGLASSDFGLWFIEVLLISLAVGVVAVGQGFLTLCQWAWKSLFFGFVICISCIGPYLFTLIAIFYMNTDHRAFYVQSFQTHSFEWFCFLSFFLSEIVALFYICRERVVSSFGEMGDLITPT